MNLLDRLEQKVETLIEGLFRTRFKGQIQPIEIGKALLRQMEAGKQISISRTYVPNYYVVYINPTEIKTLNNLKQTLAKELKGVLAERAEKEKLSFIGEVEVTFEVKTEIPQGTVEVEGQFRESAPETAEHGDNPSSSSPSYHTQVFSLPQEEQVPVLAIAEGPSAGQSIRLTKEVTIGRGQACDLPLKDNNASRIHCTVSPKDGSWLLKDLGSTNGTLVNGTRVTDKLLEDGDRIQIGTTTMIFRG